MPYGSDDILRATERVNAIDREHGETPDAYLNATGLDRFAVTVAFLHADLMWDTLTEQIQLTGDHALYELLRDNVRQVAASSMLRGIVIGEQLGREGPEQET